jgi:hypothetical protein
MENISREELDAKLARIDDKIEAYFLRAEERDRANVRLQDERDKRYELILRRTEELSARAEAAATRAASLKRHLWLSVAVHVLALAAVLAGLFWMMIQDSDLDPVDTVNGSYRFGKNAAFAPIAVPEARPLA